MGVWIFEVGAYALLLSFHLHIDMRSVFHIDDVILVNNYEIQTACSQLEQGLSLLEDVASYCETSMSRRKFILNYFGEKKNSL